MPQVTLEQPSAMMLEPVTPGSIEVSTQDFSRVVYAANDAHHLTNALTSNLQWIAETLTLNHLGEDSKILVRDAVAVCQQLSQLLFGAIGSCRAAVVPDFTRDNLAVPLSEAVDTVLARLTPVAESAGIGLLNEGSSHLSVSVDVDTMVDALDVLVSQVLKSCPRGGTVRLSYTRCGVHAVVAISAQGQKFSESQLENLNALGHIGKLNPPSSNASQAMSLRLLKRGAYVDVERRNDEIVTVFLVVPAIDDPIGVALESGTRFAEDHTIERGGIGVSGQMRSETMIVNSDRFGVIEVDTDDVLSFPTGIIGFPNENEFVLIRKADSQMIAWLQSIRSTYLTLPVVSAHVLAPRYPDVSIETFSERAGLGANIEDLAVLAVLSAPPNLPATVNLMAPIIVNAITRVGAQVMLEGTRFSTRELFVLPPGPVVNDESTAPSDETVAVHSATSAAE